jgi:hypothetical protein
MEIVVLLRALLEGYLSRGSQSLRGDLFGTLSFSGVYRINPIVQEQPRLSGALARVFQGYEIDWSQAHCPLPPGPLITQKPGSSARLGDLKIEAFTVPIPARLSKFFDLLGCQPHLSPPPD